MNAPREADAFESRRFVVMSPADVAQATPSFSFGTRAVVHSKMTALLPSVFGKHLGAFRERVECNAGVAARSFMRLVLRDSKSATATHPASRLGRDSPSAEAAGDQRDGAIDQATLEFKLPPATLTRNTAEETRCCSSRCGCQGYAVMGHGKAIDALYCTPAPADWRSIERSLPASLALVAAFASKASAHAAFWDKSMYGFNVTAQTFPYDNRPQVPLYNMTFDEWWFHGHKDYPPNDGDFFELPAGGEVNSIISCDKGATPFYASSPGGDSGYGSDSPCPGQPMSEYHTTGIDDVKGCCMAIAYKPDVNDVQPDDFVVFSCNSTCVWTMNTKFEIPKLPACPDGGCHCAWFWIHSVRLVPLVYPSLAVNQVSTFFLQYDSGSEQIYMNGFKCKVTGDVGTQPLGKPAVPRRCGADPDHGKPDATPGNCTIGAKTPMYWYQREGNNMFEDTYDAPYYNKLYGFNDGAQNDIFMDGVIASLASLRAFAMASSHLSFSSNSFVPPCPAVHDPALHIGVSSSGPRDGVPLALTSPVSDVEGAHPNTVERDSPLRDPQPGSSNAQPEPAHPGTLLTVPAHYLLMQRGGLHPAPRQISSVHLNTMFQFKAASLGQTYLSSGGARAGDLIVSCPLSDITAIYSHWRLIVWHNGYGCY
ncbi:hypothetical protein NUW54_g155 [Trametes sanguinea]|uniref:Uncharacterized protein n=1 Tax=Trametes sanguinea TaxID=158606 RepID=A0ACC1QBU6_9APHY|nr:hypothetical protein NUW54_g155 [Trametes sanguinea]